MPSAARNMGHDDQMEHDDRYDYADEYLEVLYKLWEGSWEDDAVERNREPLSTPGGMRTLSFVVFNVLPSPRHAVQGFSIFVPVPAQVGQVWVNVMMPPERRTWPAPRQVGHVTRFEPGSAPEPSHRSHVTCLRNEISRSAPRAASSSVISRS